MNIIKRFATLSDFSGNVLMLFISICFIVLSYTYVNAEGIQDSPPPIINGILIEPLDNQPVPEILKNQARKEIEQMAESGYVEAPDEMINYMENAQKSQDGSVKPWQEVRSTLKITPSTIQGRDFEAAELKMMGAGTGGILTPEGWTAVTRIFVIPGIGLAMLEEIDYVASGGGLILIKEAINQDINGSPAIFRVKKSHRGKVITELTWATDKKIYHLSLNSAAQGKARGAFLDFARSISD